MKNIFKFTALIAIIGLVAFGCNQEEDSLQAPNMGIVKSALDGTETLGDFPAEDGTGIAGAGTGLLGTFAGTITFDLTDGDPVNDVPAGVTVEQVILYWEGQHKTTNGDADIMVAGSPVTGALIGGPTDFFMSGGEMVMSSTYRALLPTSLITPGATSSIAVSGFDGFYKSNGAGILVIFDDGTGAATIVVRDGNDLAWDGFLAGDSRKICEKQVFNFAAAPEPTDRAGNIVMFASSVENPRPHTLTVEIDGTDIVGSPFCKPFADNDGHEWDTYGLPLTVPHAATSLGLEPVSEDCGATGLNPASIAWVCAAFVLEDIPEEGEGCTPGYWKQEQHACKWDDTPYSHSDNFNSTFGVGFHGASVTLLQALETGGGGYLALGRHAAAALLSAAHADVDYGLTVSEVIDAVRDADTSGDPSAAHLLLEGYNEMGCPLNNCEGFKKGKGPGWKP